MATSYSGTVKYIFRHGAVTINVQGGPLAGEQILCSTLAKRSIKPGIILAEGDTITVEVENGKIVSIKK